ncbi:MAG TPA: AraC family transcriptional regulator [Candidatus Avibacteroides faecavium]|nr:AraC family transcriptional regulator [Candidatus Avibacteroides faecavium]
MTRGTFILSFPYTIVKFVQCTEDFEGLFVEIPTDYLPSIVGGVDVRDRLAIRKHMAFTLAPDDLKTLDLMSKVLEDKQRHITTGSAAPRSEFDTAALSAMTFAYAAEAVSAIIDEARQGKTDERSADTTLFNEFMMSLVKHCKTERTVAYYAAQASLSPNHFSATIKSASGQPAMYWIKLVTSTMAKHYLTATRMSAKEIADALGFPDQSTFGRYFKSICGISPAAYREKMRD